MEAEGVGLPVVERLLATCVEKLAVTWSQYYVSFVTFSLPQSYPTAFFRASRQPPGPHFYLE
jgi:hypothetical protein